MPTFSASEWQVLTVLKISDATLATLMHQTGCEPDILFEMNKRGWVKNYWLRPFGPPRKRRLLWRIQPEIARLISNPEPYTRIASSQFELR